MEKKTMGSFLAALRRANGMTQKELAERLNVSDIPSPAGSATTVRRILRLFRSSRRYSA